MLSMRVAAFFRTLAVGFSIFGAVAWTMRAASTELLPGVDERWSRYESPNFELICDDTDGDARTILENLELLRAVFYGTFGFKEVQRLPVTIYAFRSGREFEYYAPQSSEVTKQAAGVYLDRPDRAVILLRPIGDREFAQQVVFHEYVHHLFQAAGEDPPIWYNEGMAEVLAGIQVTNGKVTIGHPLVERLMALQSEKLIPLGTLFDVQPGSKYYASTDHVGLFYAESWAILHYWKFGEHKLGADAVNRFLKVVGDRKALVRTNVRSLFEECFKMDYARMEKDLARYVRRGKYTFGTLPKPDLPDPKTYPRTRLTVDEARVRLAELAVRTNRSAAGIGELLRASVIEPIDPRIFEVLGADAWAHAETDEAIGYWEQAEKAGSTNSAVLRELAGQEFGKWLGDYNEEIRLPESVVQRLRTLLIAAIRAEPDQQIAYERFAWTEACAEKPSVGNLVQIQKKLPHMQHRGRTLVALALVRVRLDLKEQAIELIRQIGKLDPDIDTLQQAERLLADWEGRPREEIALGREKPADKLGAARLSKSTRKLPGVPVPEDL